ncbi:MAG: hypothetical protein IPH13_08845 [Planctomycetes bacterium]|nr:hypothetical protein [Planctomycetota bacterium]
MLLVERDPQMRNRALFALILDSLDVPSSRHAAAMALASTTGDDLRRAAERALPLLDELADASRPDASNDGTVQSTVYSLMNLVGAHLKSTSDAGNLDGARTKRWVTAPGFSLNNRRGFALIHIRTAQSQDAVLSFLQDLTRSPQLEERLIAVGIIAGLEHDSPYGKNPHFDPMTPAVRAAGDGLVDELLADPTPKVRAEAIPMLVSRYASRVLDDESGTVLESEVLARLHERVLSDEDPAVQQLAANWVDQLEKAREIRKRRQGK